MDKKTVIQMLQTDFLRIHEESEEISKTVQDMKQEALDYINALLSQITSTGTTSLLTKTPKVPKKRATRIKAIPENDEMEMSDDGNSLCNSMNTRSSRLNNVALETSEITSGRSKRGASIKAADIIKKQQAASLNTKLRRPSNEGSDVPLADRIVKESRSKRPKDLNSSEDEDTRPAKQSKITRKKTQSKVNDETHNLIEDSLQLSKGNETHNQEKQTRASVKRKLDDHNEDANATLTCEQSTRQISLTNDEPSAKKANYSKFSPEKQSANNENTIFIENKKSIKKNTRSSSLIDAQNSKKVNNIINETLDMSNVNETMASMYEDAIGKPIPIMNSTMNPNSTVTLDKIINVTVSLERLSSKKVLNETVTISKTSTKDPLSQVNNTMKKIIEEKVIEDKPTVPSVKAKQESKIPTILKSQRDEKIEKFDDLITDDESSPERKEYKVQKEKMLKQQKRVTRSNTSMTSDDDEVQRTPVRKNHNLKNKDLRGSTLKSAYKQAALFSPYAKDSVKKRVEAFEQVTVSPQQSETATRVTRTKTRALAAATFTEPPPLTVAQKLARKSLAKAKKISLAKHAKDNDDTKENENTNIVKPTKSSSSEKSAQKPSGKTTPLGKTRIQMPSSVTKNTYATPSNSQYLSAYSKTTSGSRGNIVTHVDSFIQPSNTSASKQIDRVAEEKRRRAHEEDARRKREELLKAQAEEKKRKREEKELKNRLAREAKERQEYEKRLKAEREREEKAKLAQQMQEKQKEEMERKRIAQLQRAQEKEERRKQEELLRLQRLQEQEEQERLLAEQKRRELEMEKRKQMEMRQQMAEMKQKNQMEKALLLAKAKAQKQTPCNYKIDSDPDEEESEDESKPKHQIPYWASKNARQPQLAMQQHVPLRTVLRFFDAKKCTPDLRELFQGIDPRKLKRSSSAIWKTPPRYSMMNCSIIKD